MTAALLFTPILLLVLFAQCLNAQNKTSPLDHYLESAKTIVVAKCLKVGPLNILLRANVDIEIIYVVKGRENRQTITVESQYGMSPGNYYLLSTKNEANEAAEYFTTYSRDSVIPIVSANEAEKLKSFSPRIAVLRTMNLRVFQLESQIQSLTYEMEALKKARIEN